MSNINTWLSDTWISVKAWFKNSETIFFARLQAVSGVVVAALAAIDWTPMINLIQNASPTKVLAGVGGMLVFTGIVTEIARRLRADL